MSERKYQESPAARERREFQESIRAEPNWSNHETSKAWLEERYPLLDDVSLGSPLFQYMKACVKDPNRTRGSAPICLGTMLSFNESMRYWRETNIAVGYDPKHERLYPGYGIPDQDRAPEPIWSDIDASRTWLEQRYALDRAAMGSPLYQYMQACRESRHPMSSPTTELGTMLTKSEWGRFCRGYPDTARHHDGAKPNPIVLYPEYDNRMWPDFAPVRRTGDRSESYPGRPRIQTLAPPPANTPMFAEAYPPYLRKQSSSSSPSNKRKGDDGDDAPELSANKKRRNPSDYSGGAVMSAKPPNPYEEGHNGLRQQNDTGSMAPPPRPQHELASAKSQPGAMNLSQQRNSKEEGSSSRQDTIVAAGIPPRSAPRLVEARKDPKVLDLHRRSTETQTAGTARGNDRTLEMPKTGGPVQKSAVAIKSPAFVHNGPMFTKTKLQHHQEAHLEEEPETGGLSHQPHEQHMNGPTIQNDNNAAHEPADRNPSKSRPDPQLKDQAHNEENSDTMGIESDDLGHQTSAPPIKFPLADPSRKRGIEGVGDEQPASSPSKKRRASPDTGDDDSLISSPPIETLLADSSSKRSIENVENASPASSSCKSRPMPSNSGGDESPMSSPSTEILLADPSGKRSIEEVKDAPPTTSPKRKRTPPSSGGHELPPSSPLDPPERSTPTPFPRKTPIKNRTRGEISEPSPLRQLQGCPAYEHPTTVILKPNHIAGPTLQSISQSEAGDGARNPKANNTIVHLRDYDPTANGGSETQEPGNDRSVTPEPESRGQHDTHVEEDPDDLMIDSEHPRDQMTSNVRPNHGDRTVQTAVSVVIPLKTPQRQPAAKRELSAVEDTRKAPAIQRKRKSGRKPGTKGRKAPQSERQGEGEKRKAPNKDRKNQQSKPERELQAYVGKLRSGVGERKHRKASKLLGVPIIVSIKI